MIAKDFCFQQKKNIKKSIMRNKVIFLRVYNNYVTGSCNVVAKFPQLCLY